MLLLFNSVLAWKGFHAEAMYFSQKYCDKEWHTFISDSVVWM